MSDISPRRRLTGRAAIAATFLIVPLTASIAYAEAVPDALGIETQDAVVDTWTDADVRQEQEEIVEVDIERDFDEAERKFAEAEREIDRAETRIVEIEREIQRGEDGKLIKRKIRYNGKGWEEMSDTERADFRKEMARVRASFGDDGELRREMAELRHQFGDEGELRHSVRMAVAEAQAEAHAARAEAFAEAEHAHAYAPRVVMACKNRDQMITTEEDQDGRVTMYVCEANADKLALNALRSARSAIEIERNLTSAQRAEALSSIDEEIAELERSK